MIELRLLEDKDVDIVETWLHTPHVKKWYEIPHLGVTCEDWMMEIKERTTTYHWLTHLIVLWNGKPIGMCQYYKCEDSDEEFGTLPKEGTYGIDYLIGESSFCGKGIGKNMVQALTNLIFEFPDAQRITADIDAENKASAHTLLSCGFVLFDEIQSRYVLEKHSLT